MRAVRVSQLVGPGAVTVEEIDEPTADGPFGPQVLVDVQAVGVSFPDLLLSKGEYQLKPELPFTLGVDFAGVVRSAPDDARSEEHTSELQSHVNLVCRLLLEKKKKKQ